MSSARDEHALVASPRYQAARQRAHFVVGDCPLVCAWLRTCLRVRIEHGIGDALVDDAWLRGGLPSSRGEVWAVLHRLCGDGWWRTSRADRGHALWVYVKVTALLGDEIVLAGDSIADRRLSVDEAWTSYARPGGV